MIETKRELKNSAEISAEISRLVHEDQAVKAAGATVLIPEPVPVSEPDENGCNWTVNHISHSTHFARVVLDAVRDVQARWNLRE